MLFLTRVCFRNRAMFNYRIEVSGSVTTVLILCFFFQSKLKKQQGHSLQDQKAAAAKALTHVCAVCKVSCFLKYFTVVSSSMDVCLRIN